MPRRLHMADGRILTDEEAKRHATAVQEGVAWKRSFWILLAVWLGITLPAQSASADVELPIGRRVEKIGSGQHQSRSRGDAAGAVDGRTLCSTPSKKGSRSSLDTLEDDLKTLWKMRSFDDVRIEWEEGDSGGIVLQYVVRENARFT